MISRQKSFHISAQRLNTLPDLSNLLKNISKNIRTNEQQVFGQPLQKSSGLDCAEANNSTLKQSLGKYSSCLSLALMTGIQETQKPLDGRLFGLPPIIESKSPLRALQDVPRRSLIQLSDGKFYIKNVQLVAQYSNDKIIDHLKQRNTSDCQQIAFKPLVSKWFKKQNSNLDYKKPNFRLRKPDYHLGIKNQTINPKHFEQNCYA